MEAGGFGRNGRRGTHLSQFIHRLPGPPQVNSVANWAARADEVQEIGRVLANSKAGEGQFQKRLPDGLGNPSYGWTNIETCSAAISSQPASVTSKRQVPRSMW